MHLDAIAAAPSPSPGDRVKAEFKRRGVSIAAWARRHDLNPQVVRQVLNKSGGSRGESHRAAVLLGLKKAPVDTADNFDPAAVLASDGEAC